MAGVLATNKGDALDLICYREYGVAAGIVEQVLEANPHIRNVAHRLPAGLEVTLPDLNVQQSGSQPMRLWD